MWKHFTLEEFACRCGTLGVPNLMQPTFIDKLDMLRDVYGKPLRVTSGYRTPAYNKLVSTTGESGPHTTGRAVDFGVSRLAALELIEVVGYLNRLGLASPEKRRVFTGIGIHQRGSARFIHLDDLALGRPTTWTY